MNTMKKKWKNFFDTLFAGSQYYLPENPYKDPVFQKRMLKNQIIEKALHNPNIKITRSKH